jgi:hypothetical protein
MRMMLRKRICRKALLLFGLFLIVGSAASVGYANDENRVNVTTPINLASARTSETPTYRMETQVLTFGMNDQPESRETYILLLAVDSPETPGATGVSYRCLQFHVQRDDAPAVTIPALEGWTYTFADTESGLDDHGQVFGIDHQQFAQLQDSTGTPLSANMAYAVYNSFIDFHTLCNVFAQSTLHGRGIQDLTQIGQTIVHASAFSEGTVSIGSFVKEGSAFRNGEVTLGLHGLSLVDERVCALVTFDSGESSMEITFVETTPEMEIQVAGRSHYWGELAIDLTSRWVRQAVLHEFVVSDVTVSTFPGTFPGVSERTIHLETLAQD